jgi:hypothetical protein
LRSLVVIEFLRCFKCSIRHCVQLDMGVTVTDLTDGIVAEVRDGIIDGALNADGVVVPFLNAKLTRNSIWECAADGNICWGLKRGVAVREFQLAKSNRTVF